MNIRTVMWLCWVEIQPFTKGWHTQFVWSWVYKILITNLSLSTHLVRLHELRGMTSRDLLCWACSGSDIHTPKSFCACVCFAPRVCVSAEARWWWDQSHLAWEVSSLKQTAALGWKQASCQSNCAGWRVDRWVSRVEHDTRNGWLTVVEAEEKSSSSFFRRMFLRGACHIYWKFHFKDQSGKAAEADRPHDRGDNVHLLSCRNSVYIMH